MKYQSELIKEIVETRGHEMSSIHYESECVESWIKEAEGAYPKLCDYQSEWLNYIVENPIGSFPYETVTNVTEATVNNVVPYSYKSASLSGQTLVNVLGYTKVGGNLPLVKNDDVIEIETPTENTWRNVDINFTYLKPNTKYIVTWDSIAFSNTNFTSSSSLISVRLKTENTQIAGWDSSRNYIIATTPSDASDVILRVHATQGTAMINKTTVKGLKVLEYVEGMESWDIPYFEGMKSVQMPVLKATGKNLFDMNNAHFISGLIHNTNLNINASSITKAYYIPCEPNTSYTISKELTSYFRICETTDVPTIRCKISNLVNNPSKTSLTITTSESAKYLCFNVHNVNKDTMGESEVLATLQIEKGSAATSYEPYKSITLTVNEEVTLRGIGEVQDTLNCLTGEVTERIKEVVFDGSENWKWHSGNKYFWLDNKNAFNASGTNTIADKVKILGGGANFPQVPQFDDNINTIDSFKQWLSQNPITVQYQLATPTIKTVDLSIQDQDGNALRKIKPIEGTMHIHSDGTPLKPTITMEIPVEATTQNLTSFIKEE